MKFVLSNIGTLKSAEINLRGITLIAGENDTGKSTVGKLLFSLVKADNIAEHKLGNYIERRKEEILEKIKTRIVQIAPALLRKIPRTIKSEQELESLSTLFRKENLLNKELSDELSELKIWTNRKKAFFERRKKEFFRQLKYNFGGLDALVSPEGEGKIFLLSEDGTELYRAGTTLQKVSFFDSLPEDKGKKIRPFRDATFICTPVVIDLVEFFRKVELEVVRQQLSSPYPFIMRDLVRKLLRERKNENRKIVEEIKRIIGGNLKLEKEEILFEKENRSFKMLGTATGIKSFGILMLLLDNGTISSHDTLLIIDEPEVHLHPKWQVEYVRVLVMIQKLLKIKILITTHSPYVVQALRFFTEGISEDVDFYLSENGEMNCVNENIGKIFDLLGEPLWKIV
jgi:predicted ATPase